LLKQVEDFPNFNLNKFYYLFLLKDCHGRMVVGIITTYAISAYHQVVSSNLVQAGCTRTTLCDIKVCQWLAAGWCFSSCTPVSSTTWKRK